ncbi:hypothetical protein [Desulfatitalea alkaliphila]|uniref:Alginate export domain-containing protein n=1 Tax=Desulfatitalea alkaliphila TaxID=2929485 RepID=A0AA41UNG7_9BACT|nr:hypothetical protein [Desulfatitalea alkaliphila]MCJ8499498.1 hypothetical protein [Desulfatitalea alkaliphila]
MLLHKGRNWIMGVVALLLIAAANISTAEASDADRPFYKKHLFRQNNGAVRGEYAYVLPVQAAPAASSNRRGAGWSLHLNAWSQERTLDAPDRRKQFRGGLRHGYLQYQSARERLRFNLGRQLVKDGITPSRIDGLRIGTQWNDHFSATLFAGLSPFLADDASGGPYLIYGGKATFQAHKNYRFSLSYQREKSGDAKAAAHVDIHDDARFTLKGLSGGSVAGRAWSEHSYAAGLFLDRLRIAPTYQHFQYRNFAQRYRGEVNRFGFVKDDNETIEIAGSDLIWQAKGPLKPGFRGRRYAYELLGEEALYMAGLLTVDLVGGSSIGMEIGQMDGHSAVNNHYLYRGFVHWRNPLRVNGFLRAETHYTVYENGVTGSDEGLQLALSAGSRFRQEAVEIKLSGTYCRDPFTGEALAAAITFNVKG